MKNGRLEGFGGLGDPKEESIKSRLRILQNKHAGEAVSLRQIGELLSGHVLCTPKDIVEYGIQKHILIPVPNTSKHWQVVSRKGSDPPLTSVTMKHTVISVERPVSEDSGTSAEMSKEEKGDTKRYASDPRHSKLGKYAHRPDRKNALKRWIVFIKKEYRGQIITRETFARHMPIMFDVDAPTWLSEVINFSLSRNIIERVSGSAGEFRVVDNNHVPVPETTTPDVQFPEAILGQSTSESENTSTPDSKEDEATVATPQEVPVAEPMESSEEKSESQEEGIVAMKTSEALTKKEVRATRTSSSSSVSREEVYKSLYLKYGDRTFSVGDTKASDHGYPAQYTGTALKQHVYAGMRDGVFISEGPGRCKFDVRKLRPDWIEERKMLIGKSLKEESEDGKTEVASASSTLSKSEPSQSPAVLVAQQKPEEVPSSEPVPSADTGRIAQLEAENHALKIENAQLKVKALELELDKARLEGKLEGALSTYANIRDTVLSVFQGAVEGLSRKR